MSDNTTSDNATFDNTTTTTVAPLVLNSGDNAWMIAATALVLMMTPALAFFYGGLVNRKNILNQLFLSIICMGIVFVQWVLFGFSFAFDSTGSRGFGTFSEGALRFNQRFDAFLSPTFPLLTYAAYQATFAIITAAIISGSVVGRMKLIPYMIFIFIWTTTCYDALAHWVWSENGWLKHLGALDFAGGTVVHISSGVSGFVASLILGKRLDYRQKVTSHNLPFTVLGASLLWVGWIGFNAGSASAANGIAALALVNTNAAAAAGLVTWVVMDAIRGRVSISGACAGPIIGLVGITPAAGFVQPGWSILFGVIPTFVIYFVILFKEHFHFDDTLDVAANHALGGIMGAFMTGLFSQLSWNSGGADGAFYGRPVQLWYQVAAILTAIGFSGACTALILLPLKYTIGIRLSLEDEIRGLDHIAHGEVWDLGEKSKTTSKLAIYQNRPPPYSNPNGPIPNPNGPTSNPIPPRSQSKRKRSSQVRLRSNMGQPRRPAYSRSQSQNENNTPQPQSQNENNIPQTESVSPV